MAISTGFGFCRLQYLHFDTSIRNYFLQVQVTVGYAAAIEAFDGMEAGKAVRAGGGNSTGKALEWKKLNSEDLGITSSKISRPTRVVLNGLKRRGFDVYVVGGCVRDVILRRVPKDFDIITSAELQEVKKIFSKCVVVGKRSPICHVHINDTIVEVSSFSTRARRYGMNLSWGPEKPFSCDEKDHLCWRNCLERDFTINGLLFDPYAKLIYDYIGGVKDIRRGADH